MFDHVLASFFAAAAFVCAALHIRVARKTLTFLATAAASLRARIAHQTRHWSPAGDDLRSGGADVGAVLTKHERGRVLQFPLFQQLSTMRRTRIAFALAI